MPKTEHFLKRQGSNFLAIMSDLKRNRQAAADDLGIPVTQIDQIISGVVDIPADVLQRAVEVWPVSHRDFAIIDDDVPAGVRIVRAHQSAASSRVFKRGGKEYYEYRDTAMSRLAPLRPEWILQLCEVDDDDAANAALQWNRGHFMHQFTMFVGAVNFYYEDKGQRKVMVGNTGDSVYITPFVPHTFATRRIDAQRYYGGRRGLILALTYGNKLVGDVQHELSAIGDDLAERYVLDTSSREHYFAALLQQQLDAATLTADDVGRAAAIDPAEMSRFLAGSMLPTPTQLAALANVLNINSRDLMPPDAFDAAVGTRFLRHTPPRRFGRYCLTDLAATRYLPYSKAVILDISGGAERPDLRVPLHQYIYNFGEHSVRLTWIFEGTTREEMLHSDDSAYLKPHLPHAFSTSGTRGRILSLRVGGKTTGEAQRELSHFGVKNVRRVYQEQSLWYNEDKK